MALPLRSVAVVAGAALLACTGDFEKQSRVSKLRILAVAAEPAELIIEKGQPPPRTTLTALAVDPRAGVIELRWALCTVQGMAPPPDLDCPGAQGVDLPAAMGAATLDLGSPQFNPTYQRLISSPQFAEQLAQGVPVIVGLHASAAAEELGALTAVTLRSADEARPPNHNPAIAALQAGGATIAEDGSTQVAAGATVKLLPVPADGAHENGADGLEHLNYSFFATGGEIQSLRSTDTTATGQAVDPSVDWVAPAAPAQVTFWVVVRDGRGGAGWLSRSVQVK